MATFQQILFLPGASGNTAFWKPVAAQLNIAGTRTAHVGWPGFGPTPFDPDVSSLPELAAAVSGRIVEPTALVAQSMGAVVAILAAMRRRHLVTHLVLAALSGGVDMKRHGARDWRPHRSSLDPTDPLHLFAAYDEDLTPLLSSMTMPVLLLWGGCDEISPVPVGEWLTEVLPRAALHVVPDGNHTFCNSHPERVAPRIRNHLVGCADRLGERPLSA
ncbi:alpha/beta fold hydrolase [Rhizobacter sp. LjRoot28]|uniref:alpha/beta fold hydrolase n=1 Tax=Rhizobacter sp. LjRoot28 TaxID=3342309 RepID=UPI003ECCB52D